MTKLLIGEKEYLVEKLPSFYEYMGYMYYCGGTIAGPFFEYKDYTNFINRTNHYSAIPTTIVPTLIRFATAICKISLLYKFLKSLSLLTHYWETPSTLNTS
jgi:D-alanyl-lipoteichoic acid acyltransferase DltB (MBOAT superfamily)